MQFDVLLPAEGDGPVRLYEVYRDDDAYRLHKQSPRLAATRDAYADMLAGKRKIQDCPKGHAISSR